MSSIHRSSSQAYPSNAAGSNRIALIVLFFGLALIFGSVRLIAQDVHVGSRAAIRPFVGAYLPTGDQRDFVKEAVVVGAQASWTVNSNAALTTSFGWAPTKDKVSAGDQTVDQFQYDVGVEARAARLSTPKVTPFIGAGIGGRTYSYRDLDVDSKSNFDGYGALGIDAGVGRVGIRIEGRDYLSRFQPLTGGGETKSRNDVTLAVGLGMRF
jgi:opacity protein-like surface antigen